MVKKFNMGNSENRSIHKTIPGTDTKGKVETKSVKFDGKCGACKTKNAVIIRVMFNTGLKAKLWASAECGKCKAKMIVNGKL